jgi:hypothetical protein
MMYMMLMPPGWLQSKDGCPITILGINIYDSVHRGSQGNGEAKRWYGFILRGTVFSF